MTTIEPLFDRILVREIEPPAMHGALHLPDKARERATQGIVIAVGGGLVKNGVVHPLSVQVGDKIAFRVPCGARIEREGADGPEVLLLMREVEVLGVFDGDD